jgi:hypothetical protein
MVAAATDALGPDRVDAGGGGAGRLPARALWLVGPRPYGDGEHSTRLTIDRQLHRVAIDDRPVTLRPKEYELLTYLALHEGVFVPRAQILADVWDDPDSLYINSLHVHVSRLRMKLGESSHEPRFVHTSRLGGVMLLTEWPPRQEGSAPPSGRAESDDEGPSGTSGKNSAHDHPPPPPRLDGIARLGRLPLRQEERRPDH